MQTFCMLGPFSACTKFESEFVPLVDGTRFMIRLQNLESDGRSVGIASVSIQGTGLNANGSPTFVGTQGRVRSFGEDPLRDVGGWFGGGYENEAWWYSWDGVDRVVYGCTQPTTIGGGVGTCRPNTWFVIALDLQEAPADLTVSWSMVAESEWVGRCEIRNDVPFGCRESVVPEPLSSLLLMIGLISIIVFRQLTRARP